VYILQVFPDESVDAGVFWDGFVAAIIGFVAGRWPFNGAVVNEGVDFVRDLGGKDEGDVVMEYGNCVSPALWKTG